MRTMTPKRTRLVSILGVLFAAVLIAASCASASGETGPKVGSSAPDFTLPTVDGKGVTLSDLRGKAVLINFWASWCQACQYEMPFLQAANLQYASQGLVVLGVDIGESRGTVQQFMSDYGLSFVAALDGNQHVTGIYKVVPIPTSFLVDAQGVIRFKKVGAFADLTELQSALKRIM